MTNWYTIADIYVTSISDPFLFRSGNGGERMVFAMMADAPKVMPAPEVAPTEEPRVRKDFPESWMWLGGSAG